MATVDLTDPGHPSAGPDVNGGGASSIERAVPGKDFGRVLRDTGGRSRRVTCDVAGAGSSCGTSLRLTDVAGALTTRSPSSHAYIAEVGGVNESRPPTSGIHGDCLEVRARHSLPRATLPPVGLGHSRLPVGTAVVRCLTPQGLWRQARALNRALYQRRCSSPRTTPPGSRPTRVAAYMQPDPCPACLSACLRGRARPARPARPALRVHGDARPRRVR